MNDIKSSVIDAIGNTPLIKLRKASELTGCTILGKAEFMNPGGSVKDRAAKNIIEDAESKGLLSAGGTIVEGTAGNTGIGLALVARAKGYKTVIVIPKTQSQEKKDAIRFAGAELIEVDAVPYANPNHYVHYSRKVAEDLAEKNGGNVIWANQFDNTANRDAHIKTTGPEIWQQTNGEIDGFICAVGSGGTLGGVSQYLKSKNENIQIGISDPHGASLYNYYKSGELKSEGSSITEGIGQSRITANLEDIIVDHPFTIDDETAIKINFDLMEHEGLNLGMSSGINIAGAIELAKAIGPNKTIVTILCDHSSRYQSKLLNKEFLQSKNLPYPSWI